MMQKHMRGLYAALHHILVRFLYWVRLRLPLRWSGDGIGFEFWCREPNVQLFKALSELCWQMRPRNAGLFGCRLISIPRVSSEKIIKGESDWNSIFRQVLANGQPGVRLRARLSSE